MYVGYGLVFLDDVVQSKLWRVAISKMCELFDMLLVLGNRMLLIPR